MKNIFFDFDGTLMNTWPGIRATLEASFRSLDIKIPGEEITPELVGMPLKKVFEKVFAGDSYKAEISFRKYRELFPSVGMSGARPFAGAVGMLRELQKHRKDLYLITARSEPITRKMLEHHGLLGMFKRVRGEQEGETPDGKEHMVAEILCDFSLRPADCVIVGDRKYDIEAAAASAVGTIGVTYGYGTQQELIDAGAGRLVGSIGELKEYLLEGA